MRNPATYDCECNNACTIDKYPEINKCSCKKCLFGYLTCKKTNCLIHTVSSVILCLKIRLGSLVSLQSDIAFHFSQ